MTTPRRAPTRRLPLAALAALLALILLATPARAQVVCSGDFALRTQSDVDAFAAQACTSVTGSLSISGSDITDLSDLSGLTAVDGIVFSIFNNDALTSLAGLENVTSVGGGLNIGSNAALTSLAGLENLTSVGVDLDIQGNAALTSLAGLGNLTSVGRDLSIGFNAALTSLAGLENLASVGSLDIEFNAALTSLAGLQNLTSVDGTLDIQANAALTSLGLEDLTSVGRLTIGFNAALTSLAGLENLTSVGSLEIEFNAALMSLAGLENLTSVPVLSISRNAALTSLAGLENLTSVRRLTISRNAALTSLAGLENLTSASGDGFGAGLGISDNDALTSLAELENLTSISSLSISGNDALTSLAGLQNVTSLDGSFGSLSIRDNAALTSLAELQNVTSVGGNLLIDSNDALTSLAGLQNVTSVGANLFIRFNATLSECSSGLAGLISGDPPAFSGVQSSVTISGNDAGGTCTSPQEVLDAYAANEPPEITAVVVPPDPAAVASDVAVSAPFTDPDAGDTHTCSIDYGDGTVEAGTVEAGTVDGFTCTGTHAYAEAGVYTVTVTVADDAGASDTQAATDFVVVYDPAAGFVTGNGWIDSPEGAYVPDPTLTGRARFGFVSKYQRGASVPDGRTQFRFNAAGLSFRSTAYEWLVIAGPHAKFKGTGTIDGAGDFGFMLTATDGDPDLFRIKIWDRADGDVVVYDNKLGEGNDSNAGTALGGGQIVIQTQGGNSAARGGTASSTGSEDAAPVVFALAGAYPNPFAVSATVAFEVPETAEVRVVIYDVLGRTVATLAEGPFEAGRHAAVLDGRGLPTGTYLVRMTAESGFSQTQRLTLVR